MIRSPFKKKLQSIKKCKGCGEKKEPFRFGASVCSIECSILFARLQAEKEDRKKAKQVLANDKIRKDAIKTLADWHREAQAEFNKFIRARDHEKEYPCISCQRFHTGKWNAGHYLSVGGHPNLRYNEDNVHLQCEPCNTYLSGNISKYRINLIERIGLEAVEAIESNNAYHKWTIEEVKAIKLLYRDKLRAFLK